MRVGTHCLFVSRTVIRMSEFARAQLYALMRRADRLIQNCQRIRRELEEVVARIERTGIAQTPPEELSQRKTSA